LRTFDLMRLRAKLVSRGVSPDVIYVLRDCLDADLVTPRRSVPETCRPRLPSIHWRWPCIDVISRT